MTLIYLIIYRLLYNNYMNDDPYMYMIDPAKVTSAITLDYEIKKLKRIDEFNMQKQLDSPIYKKLAEQNALLTKQSKDLIEQNELMKKQLDLEIEEKQRAEKEAIKAKKLNMFMAIMAFTSLVVSIVNIVVTIIFSMN